MTRHALHRDYCPLVVHEADGSSTSYTGNWFVVGYDAFMQDAPYLGLNLIELAAVGDEAVVGAFRIANVLAWRDWILSLVEEA